LTRAAGRAGVLPKVAEASAVTLLCLVGLGLGFRDVSGRPNVVLIIIDTLRADALGCYNRSVSDLSPEIDLLARGGVQFTDVTAQSSWTRPSIGSMLTSLHPRSIGLYRQRNDILDDRFVTLAEVLRRNGYETVGITANPNINRTFHFDQGFGTYIDSAVVFDWMTPEPGQVVAGRNARLPGSREVLRTMLERARRRQASTPVYMQVDLMDVHEGWRLVRPEFKIDYRVRGDASRGYWDAVRQVSYDVGRFVDEIRSIPGWANTLFVLTSDHGQGLGDHPAVPDSWGHGLLLYESQVKVPLILHHPPTETTLWDRWIGRRHPLRPGRVETPVRLLDVTPTILDYLGIAPPLQVEGRSLLPVIRGDDSLPDLPPFFVTETRFQGSHAIAVYSREWTYIENRVLREGVAERELQPVGAAENGRLTDSLDAHHDVARQMKSYLEAWESLHQEVKSIQPTQGPSASEVEILKSLGYLN
jgi:arylsulfatase A-like enzyme